MKSLKWMVAMMLTGFVFNACLDDEPTTQVIYKYAPIDSVYVGEIHPSRQVTEITTYFTRQNECEIFFDYDYQISGTERTVSLVTSNLQSNDCIDISEVASNKLQFKPENSGLYTFRFWAGNDENDEPIFIIREIEIP